MPTGLYRGGKTWGTNLPASWLNDVMMGTPEPDRLLKLEIRVEALEQRLPPTLSPFLEAIGFTLPSQQKER